ncbi:hypothetical protein E2C01_037685 [Portunus trituberculatus]|uniref:Uncharacterized protein n=1 Tax=Portunus trituberculatus TaxID=210409 RepID=A0A5B7FF92_PORTR|nr:hypothetical protein [Portunus trituberculatus]
MYTNEREISVPGSTYHWSIGVNNLDAWNGSGALLLVAHHSHHDRLPLGGISKLFKRVGGLLTLATSVINPQRNRIIRQYLLQKLYLGRLNLLFAALENYPPHILCHIHIK